MTDFSAKRATETEIFTVDFINLMTVGASIVAATWTNSVKCGSDANPSAMLIGSTDVSGTQVSIKIGGGVKGNIYLPLCTVTTSDGEVLVLPDSGTGSLPIV